MTFKEAQEFVMPFGQYKGRTLDSLASDDSGLKYLDYVLGSFDLWGRTKDAIKTYLSDPSIQKELKAALENG